MKKFSRIYIEITNVCNMACSFCIKNKRDPRFMSEEEFEHIITKIKPFTNYIYLHVLGEPLLHKNLEKFLQIAQNNSMQVNITTNGTLLAKAQDILINSPALRKVSVSLHSFETGDEQQKNGYLSDIAAFVQKASQKNIICELRFWNLGVDDIDNTDIFTKICRLLSLDEFFVASAFDEICNTGSTALLPNVYLGKATRFEWPNLENPPTNKPVFCHGLRNQIAILCDGTVVPCCLDSNGNINLGNIFTQNFENIINTPKALSIYEGFSNREPSEELCKRCTYATRF